MGFIGKSKNPKASFELANALLVKTEIRGSDATGFWACERGDEGIFYDKEATKSTFYCNRDIWSKDFANSNCDLLLAHCRATTMNGGHERFNKNNHPHVTADKRVALIHNGKITEYGALKSRYSLKSDCDSELLLGMFQSGEQHKDDEELLKKEYPTLDSRLAYRMAGVKEIFSRINYSAMAVAVGEKPENSNNRYLWLFRDDERPLHVVDMQNSLGQIFFCSTAEIWRSAVESCSQNVKQYKPDDNPIIEFPSFQVWLIATNPTENPEVDNWEIRKFRITKTKFYDWKSEDDEVLPSIAKKTTVPIAKIFSRLDDSEDVKSEVKTRPATLPENRGAVPNLNGNMTGIKHGDIPEDFNRISDEELVGRNVESDNEFEGLSEVTIEPPEIDMKEFDSMVSEIRTLLGNIETHVRNLEREGNLTTKDFETTVGSLKDAHAELKGSLIFLTN